jgi:hypothetical protein
MTITLAPGQPRDYPAGKFVVHVIPLRPDVTRVEVTFARSPQLVEGLDRSFTSHRLANRIAELLADALSAASDLPVSVVQAVEFARASVAAYVDERLALLMAEGSRSSTDVAALLQAVKAGYESPEEAARADRTAARLNADLDARARRAGVA